MDWFVVVLVLALIIGSWCVVDWLLDESDREYDEYNDWFDEERRWK